MFELDNVKNEGILQDFLNKLTTSKIKTKQICKTSFENRKLTAELTASCQCILRFFRSVCLKYCACHEKVRPGHTKCCTCHEKSSYQTWRFDAPKCNHQRPDLLTSLKNMSLVLRLPRDMHPLQMSHTCQHSWNCYKPSCFSPSGRCRNVQNPLAPATQNHILTWKGAPGLPLFLTHSFKNYSKNTAPTPFRSISGFALPSMIHNNQPLLWASYLWNFRHRLVPYYWYIWLKESLRNPP